MKWFYFGAVPVLGIVSSIGLIALGVIGRSWGMVIGGCLLLPLMLAFVHKLPEYRAREEARLKNSQGEG